MGVGIHRTHTDGRWPDAAAATELSIRAMRVGDSWEELTELLHEAFRGHLLAGRNFAACTQTTEETRRRCEGGTTLLAFKEGSLAGTATMHEEWRGSRPCGRVSQVAVSPHGRGMGTGRKLLAELERLAKAKGLSLLVCDTAAPARDLIVWYQRQGWRKVALVSHETTNYYSVVLEKSLDGSQHLPACARYGLSWLKCRLLRREDGTRSPFGKALFRLKNVVFPAT